jgi:hypothetical protein
MPTRKNNRKNNRKHNKMNGGTRKNYTIQTSLSNALPNELIREAASFLTIRDKIRLYKTQWTNFLPKLVFSYSYEGRQRLFEDYAYDLDPNDVTIMHNAYNKIQRRIVNDMYETLFKKDNNSERVLLPKDIAYIDVNVVLGLILTKRGEIREQQSRPPDEGDDIVINLNKKNHSYSVFITDYDVILTENAPAELIVNDDTSIDIKLYAHNK